MKFRSSKILDDLMNKIQMSEVSDDFPRVPEFRVSSLPYCPIVHIDKLADFYNEKDLATYSMEFYTSIGTAVHETLQKYGKYEWSDSFFGDWKCSRLLEKKEKKGVEITKRCSHQVNMTTYSDLKIKCPHGQNGCKPYFKYEELLFTYKGLSGHLDCLIKINGKFWILDFKTTGTYLFRDTKKAMQAGYYPSMKYIEQIETYALLLKHLYDIDVAAYAIVYINREKPTNTDKKQLGHFNFVKRFTSKRRKKRSKILENQCQNNEYVQEMIKIGYVDRLMEKIKENKPCQVPEDYGKLMDRAFFADKKCDHFKNGKCFTKKITTHVKKQVDFIVKKKEETNVG